MSEVVIEPAVFEDLDELSNLLGELFSEEKDFRPNKQKQLQGLRLIFEEPNRGRVFVLRRDRTIVGMINLLFTISTAEGGFVLLLEDLVVHDSFRGHGYGSQLLEYAIAFAKQKKFLRITLLTDRPELRSQNFFKRHGFYESHMLPMRLLVSPDTPAADHLVKRARTRVFSAVASAHGRHDSAFQVQRHPGLPAFLLVPGGRL